MEKIEDSKQNAVERRVAIEFLFHFLEFFTENWKDNQTVGKFMYSVFCLLNKNHFSFFNCTFFL